METRIGASVHVDPSEIRHFVQSGAPVLTFGPWPTVERVDLFLGDVATIDAVIAELVALRNEMEPYAPVITDSARTCQAKHPDTGDWCVIEGPHAGHRDCYGETWTVLDLGQVGQPVAPAYGMSAPVNA